MAYANADDQLPILEDGVLSTNENINIPSLEYGLGYEVSVSGGKIAFIEFITYGENWDGRIDGFEISDI